MIRSSQVLTILGNAVPMGTSITTNGGYFALAQMSAYPVVDQIPASCKAEQLLLIGTEAWADLE